MRTSVLAALLALSAGGEQQESDVANGLILVRQDLTLTVQENMAIARYSFQVKNVGERSREGEIWIAAPKEAAACEVTLLKHIASTDRRSKVLAPGDAAAIYAAVKERELKQEEWNQLDQVMVSAGFPPAFNLDPTRRFLDELLRRTPTPQRPVGEPTRPPEDPPTLPPDDPALLEWTGGDNYRLRFFPIPPSSDQTVTFVLALEASREGSEYGVKLPLRFRTNFDPSAAETGAIQITISSRGGVTQVASSTHTLSGSGTEFKGRAAIGPSDREFALRYSLGDKNRPFDFSKKVNWAELHPSRSKSFDATDGYCAILGKRAVDSIGTRSIERSQEISNVSRVVSPHSALIVIENWMRKEAGRK